jgi:hypothetical protein
MALKLKSLLQEQETPTANHDALISVLKQQQKTFETALSQLQNIMYTDIDMYTQEVIVNNAELMCQAYIEYCENTLSTIRDYGDREGATDEDLVGDNAGTLFTRIQNSLND